MKKYFNKKYFKMFIGRYYDNDNNKWITCLNPIQYGYPPSTPKDFIMYKNYMNWLKFYKMVNVKSMFNKSPDINFKIYSLNFKGLYNISKYYKRIKLFQNDSNSSPIIK